MNNSPLKHATVYRRANNGTFTCKMSAVEKPQCVTLARYVQRSALSEDRLLGYDKSGNILLRYLNSDTGIAGIVRLSPREFIRRWLQHVLPKGFTRIGYYGYLSSAAKNKRLSIRLLLGQLGEPEAIFPEAEPHGCPKCGGKLLLQYKLPRRYPARAPPESKCQASQC